MLARFVRGFEKRALSEKLLRRAFDKAVMKAEVAHPSELGRRLDQAKKFLRRAKHGRKTLN